MEPIKNFIVFPLALKPGLSISNIAIGGNEGVKGVDDAIFSQNMEIGYVRVYQLK